ncbi:MAG: uridylate kinase [Clostridia bacterium]
MAYTFDYELVGKIGSMALIRKEDNDIDYNIFSRLGAELKPGMIWVSSGATEIGRLDYMKRNGGQELQGNPDDVKADYASQGQSILMENYRQFINPKYSVRQVLVEHQHFNDPEKKEFIRRLLLRAAQQGAIPIINYNDSVSYEENRKMELADLRKRNGNRIVECVDNDETAAVIASLVKARCLVILTSVYGIYEDPTDPSTLVKEIRGRNVEQVVRRIRELQRSCVGASRPGANGAKAKLEYIIEPVKQGTTVIIGHAQYRISDLLKGTVDRTIIGVE